MVKILYKFILARGEWKKLCVIYSQSNRDHRTCFKGRETRDAAFANLPPSVGATYGVYTPRVVVLVPRYSMLPCRYSLSDIITN